MHGVPSKESKEAQCASCLKISGIQTGHLTSSLGVSLRTPTDIVECVTGHHV